MASAICPSCKLILVEATSATFANLAAAANLAAPLIGAVHAVNGGAVNFGADPYASTGALFDVTSGTNSRRRCSPAYLCTGEVGHDGPTGLGTPNSSAPFEDL